MTQLGLDFASTEATGTVAQCVRCGLLAAGPRPEVCPRCDWPEWTAQSFPVGPFRWSGGVVLEWTPALRCYEAHVARGDGLWLYVPQATGVLHPGVFVAWWRLSRVHPIERAFAEQWWETVERPPAPAAQAAWWVESTMFSAWRRRDLA